MEKSFELIQIPFELTGHNIYSKNNQSFLYKFRRFLFFSSTTAFFVSLIYFSFTHNESILSDRLFLANCGLAYLSAALQGYIFWINEKTLLDINKHLNELHTVRPEKWLESYTKPLFEKSDEKLYKLTKYDLDFE